MARRDGEEPDSLELGPRLKMLSFELSDGPWPEIFSDQTVEPRFFLEVRGARVEVDDPSLPRFGETTQLL